MHVNDLTLVDGHINGEECKKARVEGAAREKIDVARDLADALLSTVNADLRCARLRDFKNHGAVVRHRINLHVPLNADNSAARGDGDVGYIVGGAGSSRVELAGIHALRTADVRPLVTSFGDMTVRTAASKMEGPPER